jgi:hypothetical protein
LGESSFDVALTLDLLAAISKDYKKHSSKFIFQKTRTGPLGLWTTTNQNPWIDLTSSEQPIFCGEFHAKFSGNHWCSEQPRSHRRREFADVDGRWIDLDQRCPPDRASLRPR